MKVMIGGHRGLGCTDHSFYQQERTVSRLPVENTIESFKRAFVSGADFVELDVVESLDKVLFVLHSVVARQHIFHDKLPETFLNAMTWRDIKRLSTGPMGRGKIPTLRDALREISCHTTGCDFIVNIEIKGNQGSNQPAEKIGFFENISKEVENSSIGVEQILFSSFSLRSIVEVARLLPAARFGLLLSDEKYSSPIYSDSSGRIFDSYIPPQLNQIRLAADYLDEQLMGASRLDCIHPEVSTIDERFFTEICSAGWSLNSWAKYEKLTPSRISHYRDIQDWGRSFGGCGIITDYVPEMLNLLRGSDFR